MSSVTDDARRPTVPHDVTRFWLIRHAIVEENARARLYGQNDVPLCPQSLVSQVSTYQALGNRLPRQAAWLVSPLSRTRLTAAAIWHAANDVPGLAPASGEAAVEPGLIEQHLGEWQGLRHAELPSRLAGSAHAFWPVGPAELPPGGESMIQVIGRVGDAMERLADAYRGRDVIAVSHGGAIRAAIAHALEMSPDASLRLAVQNLSLSIVERHPAAWRVISLNEVLGEIPAG